MTAMVDVAFLLLTFFILTTKFRAEEKMPVDMPSSTAAFEVPQSGVITVAIGKSGKVLFGTQDQDIREYMLDRIAANFNIALSEEGKEYFSNLPEFGVPINQLSAWLNNPDKEHLKEFPNPGIPIDLRRGRVNELREWVQAARRGAISSGKKIIWAIKGDRNTEYPNMDKVIATLQDVDINKFHLVTSLESDPNAEKKAAEGAH